MDINDSNFKFLYENGSNNLNWLKSKQTLPIVVLIFILATTFLYNRFSTKVISGRQCTLEHGRCTLDFEEKQVSLEISPEPIALEEELNVRISYPGDMQLSSAWVEGINMFMGRTRVVTSSATQSSVTTIAEGVLFLGSCSEPKMRWRLVAEFKVLNSEKSERLYFNFVTDRS